MSDHFEITAASRRDVGKGASRRLRRLEDKVPGVVYGAGQPAVSLTLSHNELFHALEREAFYSHILSLKVDGKAQKVVLKDLQRHPFKPRIVHIDFLRVDAKSKLHMQIPLHFVGEDKAPGLAEGLGVVSHHISSVEVSCLPADLPEFITVDLSHLGLNESIHLSHLKLPKGVELATHVEAGSEYDHTVANIHPPRAEIEEEIPTAAPEAVEVPALKVKADETADDEGKEDKK